MPATYGGVVVKASPNQDAAKAFLDWLAGPDGQAVLASFGFLPPRDSMTAGAVARRARDAARGGRLGLAGPGLAVLAA